MEHNILLQFPDYQAYITSFTYRHTRIWQWERNEGISTSNFKVCKQKRKIKNKSDVQHVGMPRLAHREKHANNVV